MSPTLPGYEIAERIAAGRHGTVWRGRRSADGLAVAIKLIPAKRVNDANRFLREAAALIALHHRHIIACHDSGRDGDQLWLVMDLAVRDASSLVKDGGADLSTVLAIGRDIAGGIVELARRDITHRDITPANILQMPDGRWVLGDFGLIRLEQERMTATGEILGTPAYVAPEQACGETASSASDIYALGAALSAIATGRAPFRGDSAWAILQQVAQGPFPDPRAERPDFPLELRAIIRAATASDPAQRYPEAGQLAADCTAVLAAGVPKFAGIVNRRQPTRREAGGSAARPAPAWAWVAGGVLALLAGSAAGAALSRPAASDSEAFAAARRSGTAEAWSAYLAQHGSGERAAAARAVLQALAEVPAVDFSERDRLRQRLGELQAAQAKP